MPVVYGVVHVASGAISTEANIIAWSIAAQNSTKKLTGIVPELLNA
jgi:hypothetical protein